MSTFGLIGTITSDYITDDAGVRCEGLGGILYQAAVFCGLKEDVLLAANCGEDLRAEVEPLTRDWKTLRRDGLNFVPGAGNRVFLHYSERLKEREEILESVVPPLEPAKILGAFPGFDMLLMVFNSGFDIALSDWRSIVDRATCPIWLDVHSLVLAKKLHVHREYISLPGWRDYVGGVGYLQANRQEVASLLGHPERWPEAGEISTFIHGAFRVGVRAVFVTMGREGVLAATPHETRTVRAPEANRVVDTTGCGDVFCAKTMQLLALGVPVFEAAEEGVELASRAVSLTGVRETYELALNSEGR
ncbi:MAG: PfkB family carbohydrate kinase [Candidatus Aminicenantes bacterium]|nr:PfkB family carbohydrate kinase [Candidatus Aminicenantes bacterium]